jgi:simple sugar transport system permease protein
MHMRINKIEIVLISIIVAYSLFVGTMNRTFLNIDSLFDIIRSSSSVMILAMGLLLIMLSGGIDISFMAVALFSSYTATKILIDNGLTSVMLAFMIAVSIGVLLGLINALIISWLRLPPFIITLGTQNLFHGVMATFIGAKTYGAGRLPPTYSEFGSSTLFKIQTASGSVGLTTHVLFVAFIIFFTWFIIHKTIIGRGIVAMGNSEDASIRAGFNPLKLRLFAYGYMGFLAGISGVIYVCQVNAVYPDKLVGDELMVIAGAVIGGVSVSGGKGKVLGVVLGIFIIYLLNSTLIFIGLTASWNSLFVGTILTISIALTSYQEKKKNQRDFIFN